MSKIFPIVLAGGRGERLWPISRRELPKQFCKLINNNTPFQDAVTRLSPLKDSRFEPITILTSQDYRPVVARQLRDLGVFDYEEILEPSAKNTAPSILASAILALHKDSEAIVIISPSDHLVPDNKYFNQRMNLGLKAANDGHIVTFGVTPNRPETGYGYIETENTIDRIDELAAVVSFVEKPSMNVVKELLKTGKYYWNSGIYIAKARTLIDAFITKDPVTYNLVSLSIKHSKKHLNSTSLPTEHWNEIIPISIDKSIIESSDNLFVVPFISSWSDLGGWEEIWNRSEKSGSGVVKSEGVVDMECEDVLLKVEGNEQTLIALGLKNLFVVSTKDALLIAEKGSMNLLRCALNRLSNK